MSNNISKLTINLIVAITTGMIFSSIIVSMMMNNFFSKIGIADLGHHELKVPIIGEIANFSKYVDGHDFSANIPNIILVIAIFTLLNIIFAILFHKLKKNDKTISIQRS